MADSEKFAHTDNTRPNPSDSPIIITDGSGEIYSIKDDFTPDQDDSLTYTVEKLKQAYSIKLFGVGEQTIAPGTSWTVQLTDRQGALLVTLCATGTDTTIRIHSEDTNQLHHVKNDLCLKHKGAFTKSILIVHGQKSSPPGGGVRIRFRDPAQDEHARRS